MICPKCGAQLREERCLSGGSGSLLRQDGNMPVVLVAGVSCWRCGFWKEAEVVTVRAKPSPEIKPAYNPAVKTQAYQVVIKFYDSIAKQRRARTSWYTIATLLNQAGHNCQEKTLQKYFLLEQIKREAVRV